MIRIYNAETGETTEREYTAEELAERNQQLLEDAWATLRTERNRRLAACDWTVATDSPMDVPAWLIYRQALRDLPANTTDPAAPVWPTSPA